MTEPFNPNDGFLEYEEASSHASTHASDTPTTAFVEMSTLEKTAKVEPIVVTTVREEDDDTDNEEDLAKKRSSHPLSQESSILPTGNDQDHDLRAIVRLCLFFMAFLLACAAVGTTAAASSQYAVVVFLGWVLLLACFIGWMGTIQNVILRQNLVQVVARQVKQEYSNFMQDWRDQVLLLEDGPTEETMEKAQSSTIQDPTVDEQIPKPRRKPKSVIFQAVVQPFLGLRRRRRKKQRSKKQPDTTTSPPQVHPLV